MSLESWSALFGGLIVGLFAGLGVSLDLTLRFQNEKIERSAKRALWFLVFVFTLDIVGALAMRFYDR